MPVDVAVMTFNVRNNRALDGRRSWWFRRRSALEAIRRPDPDVAGLQEARPLQVRYFRRRLDGYGLVGVGRDDGAGRGEHCLLLYREPRLEIERSESRWFSDTPDVAGSRGWGNHFPRLATIAVLVDKASGRRFGVVVTHFDERSRESRRRSAEALVAWMAAEPGLPWVVLGDLNATVDDPAVAGLIAAGLHDALGELPPAGPGAATNHDFTGRADGTRIDHILVSPQWTVVDAGIVRDRPLGRLPSDHWPVVARLRLADGS